MKRTVYIILTIIIGIIVSFVLHAFVEMWYLNWAEDNGHVIVWASPFGNGSCALPLYVNYGLLVLGAIGGYFLGRWWWKIVYIEKRHWHRKINK